MPIYSIFIYMWNHFIFKGLGWDWGWGVGFLINLFLENLKNRNEIKYANKNIQQIQLLIYLFI